MALLIQMSESAINKATAEVNHTVETIIGSSQQIEIR